MLHRLEDAHFTNQAPGSLFVTEDVIIALACVSALRFAVQDLHYTAIGTFAKFFDEFVVFWKHKVSIEVVEAKTDDLVLSIL